eukprot:s5280_g3.t1
MERIRQEKLEAAILAEWREEEAAQLQSTWGPTPGELQAMREDEAEEYFDAGQTDYERTGVCEACNDVLHDRRSTMDQKQTQCVSLTDAGLGVAKDYLAFTRGRRRLIFAEEDAFRRAVRIALNQEALPVARR